MLPYWYGYLFWGKITSSTALLGPFLVKFTKENLIVIEVLPKISQSIRLFRPIRQLGPLEYVLRTITSFVEKDCY